MKHILVYSDSLTWGIVPGTRQRLPFESRWPGILEAGVPGIRVIEDCLNGRRTVWEDPYKPGRNGLQGLAQRMEICSPLSLVILMLGTNDFQSSHPHSTAASVAQGVAALVAEIRRAPIEPGMPIPPVLILCPPPIQEMASGWKFAGAAARSAGLPQAYRETSKALSCLFFDCGNVIETSPLDGIHLDASQHLLLGQALVPVVKAAVAVA